MLCLCNLPKFHKITSLLIWLNKIEIILKQWIQNFQIYLWFNTVENKKYFYFYFVRPVVRFKVFLFSNNKALYICLLLFVKCLCLPDLLFIYSLKFRIQFRLFQTLPARFLLWKCVNLKALFSVYHSWFSSHSVSPFMWCLAFRACASVAMGNHNKTDAARGAATPGTHFSIFKGGCEGTLALGAVRRDFFGAVIIGSVWTSSDCLPVRGRNTSTPHA